VLALFQRFPKFGAVIGFVGEEFLGVLLGPVDQRFGERVVMCLTAGQDEGKKTSLSVCNCMDFRIASASAPTNCLILLPRFRPIPSGVPLYELSQSFVCQSLCRGEQVLRIAAPKPNARPSAQTDYRSSSAGHIPVDNRTSGSRFSAMQNAAQHMPVVNALLAANISRQKRFDLRPSFVR
jgi:hypothetical protein